MNEAHLHLLTNHLPIIISACGIAILITGLILKSEIIKRVGYAVIISSAISSIPAYITGESVEDIGEKIIGIDENLIETHESQARIFLILSLILGAISIVGIRISLKKTSWSKFYTPAVIVFGLVVMYFAYKTGSSGGEIRHTEILSGSAVSPASMPSEKRVETDRQPADNPAENKEEDDD